MEWSGVEFYDVYYITHEITSGRDSDSVTISGERNPQGILTYNAAKSSWITYSLVPNRRGIGIVRGVGKIPKPY